MAIHPRRFSGSRLAAWAIVLPLLLLFCVPGGAVLLELVRQAFPHAPLSAAEYLKRRVILSEPAVPPSLVAEYVLVAGCTMLVACGTLSSRPLIRVPAWAVALMGHAALANALSPGKGLVWQLTWLVSGMLIGVAVGVWLGQGTGRGASAGNGAQAPAAGLRLPITPVRLLVLSGVAGCVLVARFLENYSRIALQKRVAAAVEREKGRAIFDDHSMPTLLLRWLDHTGDEDSDRYWRSLTAVDLGPRAGDEQLEELAALGLRDLPGLSDLRLRRSQVTDAGLAAVQPMTRLRRLSVGSQTTDAGVALLTGLPALEALDLRSTQVCGDGDGLCRPQAFPCLMFLSLSGTKIDDDDLAQLKGYTQLVFLDLSHTSITGAGLVHLKDLPSLTTLVLIDTPVDDGSIAHLSQMPRLRWLFVDRTRLTGPALRKLQEAQRGLLFDTQR